MVVACKTRAFFVKVAEGLLAARRAARTRTAGRAGCAVYLPRRAARTRTVGRAVYTVCLAGRAATLARRPWCIYHLFIRGFRLGSLYCAYLTERGCLGWFFAPASLYAVTPLYGDLFCDSRRCLWCVCWVTAAPVEHRGGKARRGRRSRENRRRGNKRRRHCSAGSLLQVSQIHDSICGVVYVVLNVLSQYSSADTGYNPARDYPRRGGYGTGRVVDRFYICRIAWSVPPLLPARDQPWWWLRRV